MKKLHLVCNAHLDPVWLWQKAEGMAEAMATFRIAADFCEKYDNFVFNHNESVLYEWVLEYEPELFERIKKLVKQGKWKIMGGWYLQPDVLMPTGESIIRQIRVGNEFFKKHFGMVPKTSINFDSFGHSRGLVQILKKCGYENYAYLRPRDAEHRPFIWEGYDGSKIKTLKIYDWYNTPKGEAVKRLEQYLKDFPDREINLVTWGIGNHGGGPSEKDFLDIERFSESMTEYEVEHSDLDTYFNELDESKLEIVSESLVHCMVGCYNSMSKVKRGHRRLENKLSMCEKMICQSGIEYDKKELEKAEKALLFAEFHDVLPGSAIKKVEQDSVRLINYGEEIAESIIQKAFFRMCSGQKKAEENTVPVIIYNPHPYEVEGDFEAEFQLAEQNYSDTDFTMVEVFDEDGNKIKSQLEKPNCTMNWDWRKKIVFHAKLQPMAMNRFNCKLTMVQNYVPLKPYTEDENYIILKSDTTEVLINKNTGSLDKYQVLGKNILNKHGLKIKAYKDNEDPWGMNVDSFTDFLGDFELLSDNEANEFRGYPDEKLSNVRVIENGEARTKVQANFKHNNSYAVITYIFSKYSKYLDIDVKILANDANTLYKLSFDTVLSKDSKVLVQSMFGEEEAIKDEKEIVFGKWVELKSEDSSFAVVNDGNHGGSVKDNILNVTLLRTPVYAAHPNDLGRPIAPHDRTLEHIDMGESDFSFKLLVDEEYVDFEAEKFNQKSYALALFPSGNGEKLDNPLLLDNKKVMLSALRKTENGSLIRLYNSSSEEQKATLEYDGVKKELKLTPFEVKTLIKENDCFKATDMLGRDI